MSCQKHYVDLGRCPRCAIEEYRDKYIDAAQWHDRAAVTTWLAADRDDEALDRMVYTIDRAPFTALLEFRAALPCACSDEGWYEHAPDSTLDPALGLRRTSDLICKITDPCRGDSVCHTRRIIKKALEAIGDAIQVLEYTPSPFERDERDWVAESRAIAASDARTEESERLRELLRLIEIRDETIRTLTRGAA